MKLAGISTSKINRPKICAAIPRIRLFSALQANSTSKIFWISAPGGFGKTTAVSAWVDLKKCPCIWYQIDERDEDPASFFHFIAAAARKISPRRKSELLKLTPEYLFNFKQFTLRFTEQLSRYLPQGYCIVIDNFQELKENSILHGALLVLMEQLSSVGRIIIISRSDPQPAYARLIANSKMSVYGTNSLRLDLAETEQIIMQRINTPPTDSFVSDLWQITDGWAAGLILMLENIRIHGYDINTPKHLPHNDVFAYFAEQVFSGLDDKTEKLLLLTSLFSRFSVTMANKLGGIDSSQILTDLCRNNFFITRHNSAHVWYQYHPLFRDFLSERRDEIFDSEHLGDLYYRSGEIAAEAGLTNDAALLFAKAEKWNDLTLLLNENAGGLIENGRVDTVRSWIAVAPESVIQNYGWLLFWDASCHLPFDPTTALARFETAAARFRMEGDTRGVLLCLASSVDISFLTLEFSNLDTYIEAILTVVSEMASFPDSDCEYHLTMSFFNAMSVRQPDHVQMTHWRDRALLQFYSRKDVNRNLQVRNSINLVTFSVWSGNISQASILVTHLRELLDSREVNELHQNMGLNILAIFSMIADVKGVHSIVDIGVELAEKSGIHIWDAHLVSTAVVASLSSGDMISAARYLDMMKGSVSSSMKFDSAIYFLVTAWRSLLEGSFPMAVLLQTEALRLLRQIGWRILEPVFVIGLAVIHKSLGDLTTAAVFLEEATSISICNRSNLSLVSCKLLKAELLFEQQRDSEAYQLLIEAFQGWKAMGNDNFIWWRPNAIAELALRALEADIEVPFVQQIVRTRKLIPANPPILLQAWPWLVKIRTLGMFSIEIDGEELEFSGKVQKKPLEMFKALVAFGGINVTVTSITEALWPDADGDAAVASFSTTLFRLRQLLGGEQVIQLRNGMLSLDQKTVWLDVWAFEAAILKARELWGANGDEKSEAIFITDKALSYYKGEFLPSDNNLPWTFSTRERLKSKYLFKMGTLCSYWETSGEIKQAVRCYNDALEVDETAEEFYQKLMNCHIKAGENAEVIKTYEKCRYALAKNLGISPSSLTQKIKQTVT